MHHRSTERRPLHGPAINSCLDAHGGAVARPEVPKGKCKTDKAAGLVPLRPDGEGERDEGRREDGAAKGLDKEAGGDVVADGQLGVRPEDEDQAGDGFDEGVEEERGLWRNHPTPVCDELDGIGWLNGLVALMG